MPMFQAKQYYSYLSYRNLANETIAGSLPQIHTRSDGVLDDEDISLYVLRALSGILDVVEDLAHRGLLGHLAGECDGRIELTPQALKASDDRAVIELSYSST